MGVGRMILMEILHRKWNFLLLLLVLGMVVAYALTSMQIIAAEQQQTEAKVAAMDDDIRKTMKDLGFNINILPKDQQLVDFYANDFADKTMPYEFVQRLADSEFVSSLNHLRPALIQKVDWQEQNRQVLMMGVSGVVPWTHRSNAKKPMSDPVPADSMNIGSALAKQLGVQKGQDVVLNGETFKVNKIYDPRGTKDDITVWIDLKRAQTMLNLPDRINLIQALECNCASIDRLAEIEKEISGVLGEDVQVIELSASATARAKARTNIANEGKLRLAELAKTSRTRTQWLVALGAAVVGFLAYFNVRQRQFEVGVLRAVGAPTSRILMLFVGKLLLAGLLGAVAGIAISLAACKLGLVGVEGISSNNWFAHISGPTLAAVFVLTPALAVMAGWLPAAIAAGQDPALILSEE
ncbi:MAG: FtsX-like permease family protein [Pirellulaceae bacterium]